MLKPKNIRRKAEISKILAKHGFGLIVEFAGLGKFVPFHWGLFGHRKRDIPYTAPEHLRMVFEDLGPTFIKLGQILSTRPDLLPEEYTSELAKLQDRIPPCPADEIKAVVEKELGKKIGEIFQSFEDIPLASASIGQVHRAVLKDGTSVVVKVQKPGVEKRIREDLEILEEVVQKLKDHWEPAQKWNLEGLLEEFSYTIRNELDYIREGRNAETFRKNFQKDVNLYIPEIFWEYTTQKVLVMEEIRGVKISDRERISQMGLNPAEIAKKGSEIYMHMFFRDGFFHGDPHPGNFIILPEGRIALLDFGMVGVMDDLMRMNFIQLMYGIVKGDMSLVMDALRDLGIQGDPRKETMLRKELELLFSYYLLQPVSELRLSKVVNETFRIVHRYNISLPSDLFLLMKTIGMAEGLLSSLDPGFRMITVIEPYIKRSRRLMLSTKFLKAQAEKNLILLTKMLIESTERTKRFIRLLEAGKVEFSIKYEGESRLIKDMRRDINRLSLSIFIVGLVVAMALIVSAYKPDFFRAESFLILTGVLSLLFAGGILWKILREGA